MKRVSKSNNRWQGIFIPLCLGFVMLCSVTSEAGQIKADSLWEQASQIVIRNKQIVPHKVAVMEETRNDSGKVEEISKLILSRNSSKENVWKPVLLNGAPVPKENEKQLMNELSDLFESLETLHPFSSADPIIQRGNQQKKKHFDGIDTIAFTLTGKKDDLPLNGEIHIDEKTGVPLIMTLSSSETFKEEGVTISDYTITVRYTREALNWHPVLLTESMTLKAKTFPFFSWVGKHVTVVTFDEFKINKIGK